MAARQMRRILVESARSKRRRKRGAGAAKVTLDEALINGILQPPAYGREPAASRTPTRPVSATAAAPPENKVWRWTLNAVRKMRVGADADGQVQTLGGFPNPMATTEVSEGTFIS